jgi:hypothetical protein
MLRHRSGQRMPRDGQQQAEWKAGERCLIEAVIADRPDFDHGDVVAVRVGSQGYFHTFWIPRCLIFPDPAAKGLPT